MAPANKAASTTEEMGVVTGLVQEPHALLTLMSSWSQPAISPLATGLGSVIFFMAGAQGVQILVNTDVTNILTTA